DAPVGTGRPERLVRVPTDNGPWSVIPHDAPDPLKSLRRRVGTRTGNITQTSTRMRTPLRPSSLLVVLIALITSVPVAAQTTYTVTVANKTANHPWVNQGWPEGYLIDGEEGAELTLVRGETYVFQLQNVAQVHPFYISTNESGGGAGIYDEGVEGNMATGNGTVTFTVPEDAPDILYYQCAFHP